MIEYFDINARLYMNYPNLCESNPTNSSQSDTLQVKFHSNRKILINYEKGLLFILTNTCLIMFFYISFRADQQREHLEKQVMVKL